MATLNNLDDQDQKQQAGQPVSVSGTAGASSAGGQSAGVGGAAPQSPVATNQAPQANTGYTDVGTYLDANRSGSADLGSKVASNLTDTYNTTKSGVDASAKSVQDAATHGYTQQNTDLINQVVSNPAQVAANDGNAALVQGQLNDKYTGPNEWADFGTQQGKVNEAMQTGALNETPGGLNVLSQRVEGQTGGSQSQGINQLDTLLLGGSPEAMQTVKGAADPFKTLNDYIHQQNTAVGSTINDSRAAADKARTDAEAALLGPNGATGQFNSQLDSQVTAARQAAQTQVDQIKSALQNENPTAQDLASIGISQGQWDQLNAQLGRAQNTRYVQSSNGQWGANTGTTDVDLTGFLDQQSPATAVNRQNVASADQYARAQALQKLVGADRFTTDLTDPSQAGTAPQNLNKFDYDKALGYTKGQADAEQKAAQSYVDAIQAGADEEHAQAAAAKRFNEEETAAKIGTGVGTVGGAVVGSLIPGAGTAAGAAVGSVAGNIAGRDAYNNFNSTKQIFTQPSKANLTDVGNIVTGGAVGTIKHLFCFHPDTLIEMADGTEVPICRLDVGDQTRGGQVLAVKKAVSSDFYWYEGVVVTGYHAVKEGGKWLRVKDASTARKITGYTEVVHNLVTTSHRIYAHGVEFADEYETDQYESLNLAESLEALNRESLR